MANYSYKIIRDYGFAPNPFFGFCTLACCKPHIRKKAEINDWIIGTGAVSNNLLNRLIFIMKVSEKLSFDEYWADKRFSKKKPMLNGSLIQLHGDNIYYKENNSWCQSDSHHSLPGGKPSEANLKQDTSGQFVLISNQFIYLGDNHIEVPDNYKPLCSTLRDYFLIEDEVLALEFIESIKTKYSYGVHGDPINWSEYSQYSLF